MATQALPRIPARPRPPRPAPRPTPRVSSPRHTRPYAGGRPHTPRAPFIVLLVGLLGGALVSLLVISTTLDQGSYRIGMLTQENNALYKEEQVLVAQVSQDQAPGFIASEAEALGMRPDKNLLFLDPARGTISSSAPVTSTP